MKFTDIRVAVGAVALLTIAGCSGAPSPEGVAASPATASSAAEAISYPVGFPVDEVPMFDGELLHVAHPGNLWAAWIASADLLGDLATATAALEDAGFTVTAASTGYAEFAKDDRVVRIVASVDGTYGSSLAYTLTDGMTDAPAEAESDAPSGGSSDAASDSAEH